MALAGTVGKGHIVFLPLRTPADDAEASTQPFGVGLLHRALRGVQGGIPDPNREWEFKPAGREGKELTIHLLGGGTVVATLGRLEDAVLGNAYRKRGAVRKRDTSVPGGNIT